MRQSTLVACTGFGCDGGSSGSKLGPRNFGGVRLQHLFTAFQRQHHWQSLDIVSAKSVQSNFSYSGARMSDTPTNFLKYLDYAPVTADRNKTGLERVVSLCQWGLQLQVGHCFVYFRASITPPYVYIYEQLKELILRDRSDLLHLALERGYEMQGSHIGADKLEQLQTGAAANIVGFQPELSNAQKLRLSATSTVYFLASFAD